MLKSPQSPAKQGHFISATTTSPPVAITRPTAPMTIALLGFMVIPRPWSWPWRHKLFRAVLLCGAGTGPASFLVFVLLGPVWWSAKWSGVRGTTMSFVGAFRFGRAVQLVGLLGAFRRGMIFALVSRASRATTSQRAAPTAGVGTAFAARARFGSTPASTPWTTVLATRFVIMVPAAAIKSWSWLIQLQGLSLNSHAWHYMIHNLIG